MSDLPASIERAIADPAVQTPSILYIRRLRSIAAEGSAAEGAVVATVNGYGGLTRIRVAPEVMADLPRLEGLVQVAVNLATDEAERLRPPPPLFPPLFADVGDLPFESSTSTAATAGEPVVRNMKLGYAGYLATTEEPGRTAFGEAAACIRMLIYRDSLQHPKELGALFQDVAWNLGDPRLTAASARRHSQIDDPNVLRRFRRETGISLTEYIRRRQRQLAAKMFYRSGLPAAEVARLLGFDSEEALTSAVEECDLDAFCDAVASIRKWIWRDELRKPLELRPLFSEVAREIHRPSLTAASAHRFVRQYARVEDPNILRRFRRAVGISLTEYIRRRRTELAAKMIYSSDQPVEDVAERLGFASEEALTGTVEQWAGCSLAELRDRWEDRGIDTVVWNRVETGEAARDDLDQVGYELARLNAPATTSAE